MKRKNIVFITADQLAAGMLHCYGGGVPSTPVLDLLADKGIRFDRCYAHVPVCAPNRATWLTGRSVDIHGLTNNNLKLAPDTPTYAHVLRSNGYRVGGFGKYHQTPMQQPLPENLAYLGFDEAVLTEDPKLGPWLDWVKREHPDDYETALAVSWPMEYIGHYGMEGINLRPQWEQAFDKIRKPLREGSEWTSMYRSPLPKELHQTTFIADQGIDFMRRHLESASDQPFFCHISFVDPHDPYDPPDPYADMFDPQEMPEPIPMVGETYECRTLESSRDFLNFRKIGGNRQALRKLRALYHGSIRFIDDQLGRIVDWLEAQGIMDRTLIVFTTDHGDMMGDHGLIAKGFMHYDKSIRCPLVVYGAGVKPGKTDRLTSSLDFFPTFCEWAGVSVMPPVEGKSFAAVCAGQEEPDSWQQVTVQYQTVRSMVTEDGWRLTVYDEPGQGEMFNLREDPREIRNLYHNPDWAARKMELLERLVRAYMQQGLVQQYRNLPIASGERCTVDGFKLNPSYTLPD